MPPEGCSPVPDVFETELFGDLVRTAEVKPAASEDPAHPQDGPFYDSEAHDAFIEVFGAGGTVDAVCSQEGRDEFLVALDRNQEYFPCNISFHMIKVASGWILFNPRV